MNGMMLARMFSPMIMRALSKAPTLMTHLQRPDAEIAIPNIIEALQNQQDPMLMEEMLTHPVIDTEGNMYNPLNVMDVDFKYTEPESFDEYGEGIGFPSDGAGNGLANLFASLTTEQQQMVGGDPAEISAAVFQNNPVQQLPGEDVMSMLGNVGDNEPTMIDGVPYSDSALDDIHSTEMWESGNKFKPGLRNWFLKNKR